ncbi:MAG: prolipoprotein diacylglyceryl transferase family protein [Myxococcota bacterium]
MAHSRKDGGGILSVDSTDTPTPLVAAPRTVAIVVAYVLAFFGLLPLVLIRFGQRVDTCLGLPPIAAAFDAALGAVLVVAGGTLLGHAMLELWEKGRGLPISHLPPARLVASGWYRRFRHPIYVGYSVAFAGMGCWQRSLGVALFATTLLVVGWCLYAAFIEEPLLLQRFGASYRQHLRETRRVPLPHPPFASGLYRIWNWLKPLAEWLARHPVWFSFGACRWVGYGGLVAIGAGVAAALASVLLSVALSAQALAEYVLGLTLSMLVGGRLAWLGYEWRAFRAAPVRTLRRVGFVSFGAYVAMFCFALAWPPLRAPAHGALWFLDRTMLACLVCSGFGRLGCLSYGCCYGKPWAHGMRFLSSESKVVRERDEDGYLPRVPTQLLSALLAFASAALLFLLLLVSTTPGFASCLAALLYALARFAIEGQRDEERFLSNRLTRGQIAAAGIALTALAALAFAPFAAFSGPSFIASLRPAAAWSNAWLPLATALSVFIVCGYHRRHVGSW